MSLEVLAGWEDILAERQSSLCSIHLPMPVGHFQLVLVNATCLLQKARSGKSCETMLVAVSGILSLRRPDLKTLKFFRRAIEQQMVMADCVNGALFSCYPWGATCTLCESTSLIWAAYLIINTLFPEVSKCSHRSFVMKLVLWLSQSGRS